MHYICLSAYSADCDSMWQIGVINMEYTMRKIKETEYPLLKGFLYEAIFVPEGVDPPPKSIVDAPELQVYISGFGSEPHDIALIAETDNKDEESGRNHREQETVYAYGIADKSFAFFRDSDNGFRLSSGGLYSFILSYVLR